MPALSTFQPLRAETIDTIRARIDANVNAGLDPADTRWQDTVPGGWFYDHTQAVGLELELLWDFTSLELPASFFLPYSWGIYLDYWGEMLDVLRNPPVAAVGTVTFTNPTADPVDVSAGTEVAVPATDPALDPLVYAVDATVTVPAGGTVDAVVTANATGEEYNVAAGAVNQITTAGLETITVVNADSITGGADEELDEPYKARLLLEFTGTRGGGTPDDYIADTIKNFPAVGHVVVERAWAGPNTVRLVISDANNAPLAGPTVDQVQAFWDDEAPIDAAVTVTTVTDEGVDVSANIVTRPGFSLDGADNSTPLRADLVDALQAYFHDLPAGDAVQHNRVLAALIASVEGVYDVTDLTLNGVAGDVAVTPLQSATLNLPPTFTESAEV